MDRPRCSLVLVAVRPWMQTLCSTPRTVRGFARYCKACRVSPGPDAISIGAVPHEWLFPQMAAVVHHAGAGTAAAGLRAGVPTVSVPIYTDQPFWAARITSLGGGPQPVPYKELTTERLADAITQATTTPAYAARERQLAAMLATEDGTTPVATALRAAAKQM
ncbi:UDP:flavonoid glycosyltransferase YjiC (YdhE family) [Arthrobacter sp. SORGH_AS 212]|nr:UDP:flavonoid glycosyltransferase YjiC (YdhE family) [Arthrobacter sp. SORGH_AS_0212]